MVIQQQRLVGAHNKSVSEANIALKDTLYKKCGWRANMRYKTVTKFIWWLKHHSPFRRSFDWLALKIGSASESNGM